MSTLREAAQQALEALEAFLSDELRPYEAAKTSAALRAALAQQNEPVQEPVAWMVYTEGGTSAYVTDNPHDLVGAYRALPLYTAPSQRKPRHVSYVCPQCHWSLEKRKPLTDDQARDVVDAAAEEFHKRGWQGEFLEWAIHFTRAVEAAHGIKDDV